MEEERTRPRAAERVTQGTPQVTTITTVLRVKMQIIMMVAINGGVFNPISTGGRHIVPPLLRICVFLCKYAYKLVEKT